MNPDQFDRAARDLASGVSRRQVVKGLAAAAVGGLLARVGLGGGRRAEAGEGSTLRFPLAMAPCPPERLCGEECCGPDQRCENGTCISELSCGEDFATFDSIEQARAAVEAGATSVNLSPGGCLSYQRTLDGDRVTSETFLSAGVATLVYEYDEGETRILQDSDADGFTEWQLVATSNGEGPDDDQVVITIHSAETQEPIERKTYTREGETLFILLEVPDEEGAWQPVAQYERGPWIEAPLWPASSAYAEYSLAAPAGTCSAQDCSESNLRQKFRDAVNQGLQCLHSKGATALERRLTARLFKNPITLGCASIPPRPDGNTVLARTFQPWPIGPTDALIEVNQDEFCNLSANGQLMTLFHEFMHLEIHEHDEQKETSSRRDEVDQIYACSALCFNPPNAVSQCTCATCLETTKCDSRCDTSLGYQQCSDDFGAWCPCPTRLQWYPSCSDCLVGCPSGLACSFFSFCIPVNRGRCTPTTCP